MTTMSSTLPFAPQEDDERRWQAVVDRDRAADGRFWLGVATTGIYCRPSCAARRPRRENVRFFSRPEDAERAGFRPCRRCDPRRAGEPAPEAELVAAVRQLIEASEEVPTLERLARETGWSPYHLQRTFKRATGMSPRDYARAQRTERLKRRLRGGDDVTTALYAAGYGSSRALYEGASAQLGMTPSRYRRRGAGLRISYTLLPSPLGDVLLAGTESGLCAVRLGSAPRLVAELRDEFRAAEVRRDDRPFAAHRAALRQWLDGGGAALDFPLAVDGTPFQWRVWAAIRDIPYGETRTYGEIARAIGRPGAARAVARACASNPVALVIPCHRVVRGDGEPGGYRWGAKRKKQLLAAERKKRWARVTAARDGRRYGSRDRRGGPPCPPLSGGQRRPPLRLPSSAATRADGTCRRGPATSPDECGCRSASSRCRRGRASSAPRAGRRRARAGGSRSCGAGCAATGRRSRAGARSPRSRPQKPWRVIGSPRRFTNTAWWRPRASRGRTSRR